MWKVKGKLSIQFNNPKLFSDTQSAVLSNRKANEKLTKTVVNVKKKLGIECFIFLYSKLKRGIIDSIDQKKVIPKTNKSDLSKESIFSKK